VIVVAYFLVKQFGFISGIGITALCWVLSMVIADDRAERIEDRREGRAAA
jgi:hypothetical protein